ncbi:MAG TPA: glutathione peroxidase, partial [Chitinophagales bacterium]|nr:glutathione peroxidase [Chitinophagales bacterium]
MSEEVQTIYPYTSKLLNGKDISFDQFRGKVILVVNTASRCGHDYQLGMLEAVYKKYKD